MEVPKPHKRRKPVQLLAQTKAKANSEPQGNLYDPLVRQKEKDEAIYEDIDKPEASPLHPPVPAPRRFLGEFMRDLVHDAIVFHSIAMVQQGRDIVRALLQRSSVLI